MLEENASEDNKLDKILIQLLEYLKSINSKYPDLAAYVLAAILMFAGTKLASAGFLQIATLTQDEETSTFSGTEYSFLSSSFVSGDGIDKAVSELTEYLKIRLSDPTLSMGDVYLLISQISFLKPGAEIGYATIETPSGLDPTDRSIPCPQPGDQIILKYNLK